MPSEVERQELVFLYFGKYVSDKIKEEVVHRKNLEESEKYMEEKMEKSHNGTGKKRSKNQENVSKQHKIFLQFRKKFGRLHKRYQETQSGGIDASTVAFADLLAVAKDTEGFSGRDLAKLMVSVQARYVFWTVSLFVHI